MTDRRGQEETPRTSRPGRPSRAPNPPPPPGGWQGNEPPEEPAGPGDVELGVLGDLEAYGALPRGRSTLRAMAVKLARTIDARGDDEAASALAKAVDTLRTVMNQLMAREVTDPNALGYLGALLGAPDSGSPSVSPTLRYPPNAKPADGGAGNRSRRPRA